jgi:hypothetical protein
MCHEINPPVMVGFVISALLYGSELTQLFKEGEYSEAAKDNRTCADADN